MKEKNKPLLKLMSIVLRDDTWEHGNTSRFARALSRHIKKNISRSVVHGWLIHKGVPAKYLNAAVEMSGGEMTYSDLRPDIIQGEKDGDNKRSVA